MNGLANARHNRSHNHSNRDRIKLMNENRLILIVASLKDKTMTKMYPISQKFIQ